MAFCLGSNPGMNIGFFGSELSFYLFLRLITRAHFVKHRHPSEPPHPCGRSLEKMYFLGLQCPAWLMPQVTARETGEGQMLHFQIQVTVPFVGRVASYTGYLIIRASTFHGGARESG